MQKKGYQFASYDNFADYDKCAILRHDVDFRLQDAYEMSAVEQKEHIKSTYFVLLTSDFYNVFSRKSRSMIDEIRKCGHEIGLHFDEARYPEEMGNTDLIRDRILEEAEILSKAVGVLVTKVSMHRPSKNILCSNLEIPGMVNTYSDQFFNEFKYFSDSRRFWREPIEDIIQSGQYHRVQILMHPFWYDIHEIDRDQAVRTFVNSANAERYQVLTENISDLPEIMGIEEIR
ncbi:MAG: hypothetical protein K2I96_16760 [Lachnospiraceae bacterium]|nr:hypothetical protein [Lachnospiraceae bacterium]